MDGIVTDAEVDPEKAAFHSKEDISEFSEVNDQKMEKMEGTYIKEERSDDTKENYLKCVKVEEIYVKEENCVEIYEHDSLEMTEEGVGCLDDVNSINTENEDKDNVNPQFFEETCKTNEIYIEQKGVTNDVDSVASEFEDPLLPLPEDDVVRQNSNSNKRHVCDICNQRFHYKKDIVKHMKVHKKKKTLKCEVCNKSCNRKVHLIMHMRTHTKERPFPCEICDKRYSQKDKLKIHMRVHTNERPYACEICARTFTGRGVLVKHMKRHTKEKLHSCEICSKQFVLKTNLVSHMKMHAEKKPFACHFCGKQFTQKSNLTRHTKLHTSGKNHICSICNRAFSDENKLGIHKLVHSEEKDFRCQMCDKNFRWKKGLLKHMKKTCSVNISDKTLSEKSKLLIHRREQTEEEEHIHSVCSESSTENGDIIEQSSEEAVCLL